MRARCVAVVAFDCVDRLGAFGPFLLGGFCEGRIRGVFCVLGAIRVAVSVGVTVSNLMFEGQDFLYRLGAAKLTCEAFLVTCVVDSAASIGHGRID